MEIITGSCSICHKIKTLVPKTDAPICPDCYIEMSTRLYLEYKKGLERENFYMNERRKAQR